jgi:hypothetical protein
MSLRDEITATVKTAVDDLRRIAIAESYGLPDTEDGSVKPFPDGAAIADAVLALLAEKGEIMWSCETHGVHPLLDDRCAYDPEGECGGGVRLLIPWEADDDE